MAKKNKKAVSRKNKAAQTPRKKEESDKQTFFRRVWRALPVIGIGLLLTFIFSRTEAVQKFQTSFLDTQMRLDNPAGESDVVIVEITQKDFDDFFEGKSRPLNPPKLHQLISEISIGKPCVIGVDIDTSFRQFGADDFRYLNDWSPIIWAREPEKIPPDTSVKPVPLDVLGGQNRYNETSGLTLLITDPNGVLRRYTRTFETDGGKIPAFPWAIYRRAAKEKCHGINFPSPKEIESREAETSELFIRYSRGGAAEKAVANSSNEEWTETANHGRIKISVASLLEFAKISTWQNNSLIKDKIVLIGGSYGGDDIHQTPLGEMSGVEAVANVIETELRGGGIKPPTFPILALIGFFDGVLLLIFFYKFSWRTAFLLSVITLLILSLAFSYFTFYSFSYWLLYAPVMLGILILELIDRFKDQIKDRIKKLFDSD